MPSAWLSKSIPSQQHVGIYIHGEVLQRVYDCLMVAVILDRYRFSLQWRDNKCDGASNHGRLQYLLNRGSRRRAKKTSKLRVTGLCEGNSPVTGEIPTQRASNAENGSTWRRHHHSQGDLVLLLMLSRDMFWSFCTAESHYIPRNKFK